MENKRKKMSFFSGFIVAIESQKYRRSTNSEIYFAAIIPENSVRERKRSAAEKVRKSLLWLLIKFYWCSSGVF
jgi:hypothetical protein